MSPYYDESGITIYHGDCREILPELEVRPNLVLTDPPYIVTYVGRHDSDDVVEGMEDSFWVLPTFRAVERVMAPDSFAVSFYSWRHADEFLFAWRAAGLKPVGHLVWVKSQMGLGKYVRAKHECAYLLTKGAPKPALVVPDVFEWKRERTKQHPAQKPTRALLKIIDAIGPTLILDPFMGAGATLLAAKILGVPAIGIEIEERYCEIAAKRLGQEVLAV